MTSNNANPNQKTGSNAGATPYPKWDKAWQNNQQEIDNVICGCAGSNAQPDLDKIQGKVQGWFDSQSFDPQTSAEYDQVKQHPQALRSKVEQRVDYLRQNGKLGQPQTMQAGAGQAGGSGSNSTPRASTNSNAKATTPGGTPPRTGGSK